MEKTWFLLALLALTLVRWLAAGCQEIQQEEAVLLARASRWTLIDGFGGGLALPLLWCKVSGVAEPFSWKWIGPLFGLLVSLQLRGLLRQLGASRPAWGVLLLNVLPVFHGLTLVFSPVLPAMLLAVCGVRLLIRGLHEAGRWPSHFALAGVFWGLAALCHGAAVVLVPLALGFLVCSRRWRVHLFQSSGFILVLDFLLVALVPRLFWNREHDGLGWSIWWETACGAGRGTGSVSVRFMDLLATQSPFWLSLVVLLCGLCLARVGFRRWGAFFATGLVVLGFGLAGYLWTAAIWQLLTPLLAAAVVLLWQTSPSERGFITRAQASAVVLLLAGWTLALSWPSAAAVLGKRTGDKGWQAGVAELASQLAQQNQNKNLPGHTSRPLLLASSVETAALVDYYFLQNGTDAASVQPLQSAMPQGGEAFWPRYDSLGNFQLGRPVWLVAVTNKNTASGPPRAGWQLQQVWDSQDCRFHLWKGEMGVSAGTGGLPQIDP